MGKMELISAIYKILLLFEDVADINNEITEEDYLKYLDRLYIRFSGKGNDEIVDMIRGLYTIGTELSHDSVRSTVFYMINLIEKEGVEIGS